MRKFKNWLNNFFHSQNQVVNSLSSQLRAVFFILAAILFISAIVVLVNITCKKYFVYVHWLWYVK